MSGRPVFPTPLSFVWAPGSATYPVSANPWSATPVKVAPVSTYFTPDDFATAMHANYLWGEISKSTQDVGNGLLDLGGYVGQLALGAWPAPARPQNIVANSANTMCWDEYLQSWLVGWYDGTATLSNIQRVLATQPDMLLETPRGTACTSSGSVSGMACDGAGRMVTFDLGLQKFITANWATGGGVVNTDGGTLPTTATAVELAYFAGPSRFLAVVVETGANGVYYRAQAGTSWTRTTLPSPIDSYGAYRIACSPTLSLIVPHDPLGPGYASSTDGITWTFRSLPLTWANTRIRGVAYSPELSQWMVVGKDETDPTGTCRTVVSSDGVNWTERTERTSFYPTGLAVHGTLWVCSGVHKLSGQGRIYTSTDSGVTWQLSPASGRLAPTTDARMYGSPAGVAHIDSGLFTLSAVYTRGDSPGVT